MGKKGGHCAGAEQRQWRDVTEAMTSVAERGGAWSIYRVSGPMAELGEAGRDSFIEP